MLRINLRSGLITSIFLFAALCTPTFGKTIYVDDDAVGNNDGSSWVDAYKCLQNALSIAQSGDEIWVANGTYQPDRRFVYGRLPKVVASGIRTETFQLKNGVTIKGGYAGFSAEDPNAQNIELYETILSGDLASNDVNVIDPCDLLTAPTRVENSYHVVTGSGTGETAVLDGFIITGGNANSLDAYSPYVYSGGMYNENGSPLLKNCTFIKNSANDNGGAVYNLSSQPVLQSCTFVQNYTGWCGGGLFNHLSSPQFTNCTFEYNKAYGSGGGMGNNESSAPILNNCIFNANSTGDIGVGGGAVNGDGCSPEFMGCTFIRNSAYWGGGGVANSKDFGFPVRFVDCTFIENTATGGGAGMDNRESSPIVTHCEFSGNWTDGMGGAIINGDKSQPILTDCLFNGNSANSGGAIQNWFGACPQIINCTFTGNTAGWAGGAILDFNSVSTMTNCLFSNNLADGGGVMFIDNCIGSIITNCTFAGNTALFNGDAVVCNSDRPSHVKFTNCIIWDENNEIWNNDGSIIELTNTNIQGGQAGIYDPCNAVIWGKGNINTNPLFVKTGHRDPNDPNLVWVVGDYHLKSEAGRWDPVAESWIVDDVTSPCIDVGDPNSAIGDEPEPNGGIINMGAYGGTAEASMSPAGAEQIVYVQWLGHSTVKVWTDDCIVYIDPERVPDSLHDATLVCVTHTHGDHYSPSDIAKVSNDQTQFIGPPDVVQRYGSGQTIAPDQTIEFDFVTVTAVPAYNINKSNHPKSNNWVGYIIELGGKRIYVAGDTDLIDEMKSLGDIDVAFLPAGGTYTMNATEAAEATGYIKPDLAIPYHWGQSVGTLADAQRFAELAQCPAMVLTVGEMISSDNWPEYSPLIAHWALDEAEGDIAHDSAGENHGTLSGGPTWQPAAGKIAGAIEFDGIDDYISTDFVLDPANGPFSVFAWIKGGALYQVIISQADILAGRSIKPGSIWLCVDPLDGKLMTYCGLASAGSPIPPAPLLVSESIITDGQWHHIGFASDGSYRILYVDGTEVARDTAAQNPLQSATSGLRIGAGNYLEAGNFFSGLIDDVRIYNEALTTDEIEALVQ